MAKVTRYGGSVRASGFQDLLDKLNASKGRVSFVPVSRAVYDQFLDIERELFRTSGMSGLHGKWPKYQAEPKYWKYKQAVTKVIEQVPLVWEWNNTTPLKDSLTNRNHPDAVFNVNTKSLTMGTANPNLQPNARGGIGLYGEPFPRRRAIDLTQGQVESMIEVLASFVLAPWRSGGDRQPR